MEPGLVAARCGVLFAVLLQAGCLAPLDNYLIRREAEQQFTQQNICPADRLVVDRLAVDSGELFRTPPPPSNVAADPERLKVWNETSEEALNRFMAMSAVRIRGCGVEAAYLCWDEWIAGEEAQHLSPLCFGFDQAMQSGAAIGRLLPRPGGWRSLRARLAAQTP